MHFDFNLYNNQKERPDPILRFHHDHLDTPIQATDKTGNIVWAANYNIFGQATITTPAATADSPTITANLRLPGQYYDDETGLHYNFRGYYDPSTGRYITQDPIGLAGGDNQYRYGEADPANVSDPTGECPWCVAFALCMAECAITTAVINAATGECNNWGNTAKDCAIGCAAGMGLGWLASKLPGLAKKAWDAIRCGTGFNSFAADTLVHVKPDEAMAGDAKAGKSRLKPINQINVGDEVLAFSEWKDKGKSSKMDRRLSYEKVTDVYTSYKAQTLVHLTLDDGQTLTATEGHPFKTADGWRDAIMLKKGGKLLLKGGDGDADAERTATIAEVRTEQKTLPVYNLEVANGHTYFVGIDGELVHNACHGHHPWPKYLGGATKQKLTNLQVDLHKLYHKGLDQIAPRRASKVYYDNLPKPEIDKVLEKFKNYTEAFDNKHGTDLLNDARNNGFMK